MPVELIVVGAGRMGEAIVGGLLTGGITPEEMVLVEASPARRAELNGPGGLAASHAGMRVVAEPEAAGGAIIAVKPSDVEGVCRLMASLRIPRVLSIAAGVPTRLLEEWLDPTSATETVEPASGQSATGPNPPRHRTPVVLRAMPNLAAVMGASATAVCKGRAASDHDLAWAKALLESVGTVALVPESLLDAVTGLSGSGPAYVFLVAEALVEGGVLVGLPRDVALQLTTQTILGAARMLSESGLPAEALRAAVTSPGGTTAAGLRALEAAGVRGALMEAVAAATERARALGS
ncbi:MAG: pyrroline-5-carboxylate reductase [Acidimicrobiales bacterium]